MNGEAEESQESNDERPPRLLAVGSIFATLDGSGSGDAAAAEDAAAAADGRAPAYVVSLLTYLVLLLPYAYAAAATAASADDNSGGRRVGGEAPVPRHPHRRQRGPARDDERRHGQKEWRTSNPSLARSFL